MILLRRLLKNRLTLKLMTRRLSFAVMLIVLSGFACNQKNNSDTNLGTVTYADLIQKVTLAGTITPNRKTMISAPYNGYVRKLYVKVGDQVRENDPIVSVTQSLRGTDEEVYPLLAPFPGTVVQVLKTEGEFVDQQGNGGNALVRISDLSRMYVEANSPEIDIVKLKVGQEVIVKVAAVLGRTYRGKILNFFLSAKEQRDWDKSRVEFPVLIEILDKDIQIKPGMSVIIDIITTKLSHVLTLRHEFIQKDGEKYFVVTEKGETKNIDVGLQNEEVFELKKGVVEGDRIRQTDFLTVLKKR